MRRILMIAVALVTVCGCIKDVREAVDMSPEFTAGFEGIGTKTYVDEDLHLYWTAEDRISIFTSTYNQQYAFKGRTGANSGSFRKLELDEFVTGSPMSQNIAVYPYNDYTTVGYDGVLSVDLPLVQFYAPDSFGLGANTMVAVTKNSEDYYLSFQNVCGYIVVRLYGQAKVKNITLTGNNGERLSGAATITAVYGQAPTVQMLSNAGMAISLDSPEGVELGTTPETATSFWFCVPPVTFSKGFTVVISDENNNTFEKSVSRSKTVSRNVINRMEALEVDFTGGNPSGDDPADTTPKYVDLGLSVKWATFNIGATKPEEYGDYFAWGELATKTEYTERMYEFKDADAYNTSGNRRNETVCLGITHDAAQNRWHDFWRMPNKEEWDELFLNCDQEWVNISGTNGVKLTSNVSGYTDKSIFLPATGIYSNSVERSQTNTEGYYWSSSLYTADYISYGDNDAWHCCIDESSHQVWHMSRFNGLSVRAVYDDDNLSTVSMGVKDFGDVVIGQSKTLRLTIENQSHSNLIVSNVSSDLTCLSFDWTKGIIPGGGSQTVNVTFAPLEPIASGTKKTIGVYMASFMTPVEITVGSYYPPQAIDLGLTVKWANYNVGAKTPEEYGDYYAWGETETKTDYSESTYKWYDSGTYTKYADSRNAILLSEDDVAHVKWGGNWRMPTISEIEELIDGCKWTWTVMNGKAGYLVSGKKDGYTDKSIFLPAAGEATGNGWSGKGEKGKYWSSELVGTDIRGAYDLIMSETSVVKNDYLRDGGFSVRPVSN